MSEPSPLRASLSAAYLREWQCVPIRAPGGELRVLTCAELDPQVVDDLRWIFRQEPVLDRVAPGVVSTTIERLEQEAGETAEELISVLGAEGENTTNPADSIDLGDLVEEAPVVRLVNLLLGEALAARASDVHLEAGAAGMEVRYRVDGVLRKAPAPPVNLAPAVVGRLKVMAELDVAERRRPQDGRTRLRLEGRSVDVRVSTLPTLHGESVVLRLLEAEGRRLGLGDLGMEAGVQKAFESLVRLPHGVVLATGPTGNGKTTTLYAALDRVRTGEEKIVTVEDPVEYSLAGVAQVPVNRKAGVTFASALRSILRQDPDVVLVGEMRDAETAEICTQAALTGHMVLSTLHTNDAVGALVRLQDLGVEPYLVASTVQGVLAQRLVRIVCPECAEPSAPDRSTAIELERVGLPTDGLQRGRGCLRCGHTGYRGRLGIYELLVMGEEIRSELLQQRGGSTIRKLALEKGMRPLRADGWRQVAAGVTTPDEVLRVTQVEQEAM